MPLWQKDDFELKTIEKQQTPKKPLRPQTPGFPSGSEVKKTPAML